MIAKPDEHPAISDERIIALKEATEEIDKQIYRDRGIKSYNINIAHAIDLAYSTPPLMDQHWKGWLWVELARLYSEEGKWRFVTVYESYRDGSHPSWEPYIYLSNISPLQAVWNRHYASRWQDRHLAGNSFNHSSTHSVSQPIFWLIIAICVVVILAPLLWYAN